MEIKENVSKTRRKYAKIKKKIVLPILVVLTGIFVFTTANVHEQVLSMFLGSVAGFSLLTIIFFVANMLKEQTWKEAVKPYAAVFALLLFWSLAFAGLRLAFNF